MCTLTWRAVREGGYDLFFNRDELNTRKPEQPPFLESINGVSFVAPRDGDRGGSWILANAHGLTVALLNDYGCSWRPPANGTLSRGALVMACATAATPKAVAALIGAMTLERVGAFKMVVLGADGRDIRLHWNGDSLSAKTGGTLFFETSSSFATKAVCEARQQKYEALLSGRKEADADELERFHWTHDPAYGAGSVLMRRPDARTRSAIKVKARPGGVVMHYQSVSENVKAADASGMTVKCARL